MPRSIVTDDDVRALLLPHEAARAMKNCFIDLANGVATNEPRHRMPWGEGSFNAMWAASESLGTLALKAYPVIRGDVRQATAIHVFLFDMTTGDMHTTMRGDALGQIRTGAASAVAAEQLVADRPKSLALFGAGYQAQGQARALLHQFPSIDQVLVVSRTPAAARGFSDWIAMERADHPVEIIAAEAETAVRNSTLVVTATASSEPLFDGDWLQPGTHVTSVGSNHHSAREIDSRTVSRASIVVVDSRVAARQEAGDLIMNGFDPIRAVELGELLTAPEAAVHPPGGITLFTSQGLAAQDLYAASAVLSNRERESTTSRDGQSDAWSTGVRAGEVQ